MRPLTLVTITADRPEAFKLCQKYVEAMRKDYPGETKWKVADGGRNKVSRQTMIHTDPDLYPTPMENFYANLRAAFRRIEDHETVFFIEDDDYYPPHYLRRLAPYLDDYDLVGETNAHHWHVPSMRYAIGITNDHASLAQTAICGEALKVFRRLIANPQPKSPYLDMLLWRRNDLRKFLLKEVPPIAVGIKAMPGKKGFVAAHDAKFYKQEDRSGRTLESWIGKEAARPYLNLAELDKFPVLKLAKPQTNLLYFITPIGSWKENLKYLQRYITIFDGKRYAFVAVGKGAPKPTVVDRRILSQLFSAVYLVENDPELRETAHLARMLASVESEPGITFFAHTKGVTSDSPAVKLWTKALYEKNLEDMKVVRKSLQKSPVTGSFKRYGYWPHFPPMSDWHYSGTFFWFVNELLFKKDWKRAIVPTRYGAEAFPSLLFRGHQADCLFGDDAGDLYDVKYVQKLLRGKS